MKGSYLIRKDQRHQGWNPQRKQEKAEVKIGKVELQNMKDSYLIRKDQRHQGRNPQRKQEKAEVKIGKVELQNMKDSTERPTTPGSESSKEARES